MNRELKFKLYHKPSQRMFLFDPTWGNYEQGDGWVGGVPFEDGMRKFHPSNQEQLSPNSCEWMQYTGLKDKLGKEIYEGDIVTMPLPGLSCRCQIVWSDTWHGFVAMVHGYAKLEPFPIAIDSSKLPIEIVGNVWENKETL